MKKSFANKSYKQQKQIIFDLLAQEISSYWQNLCNQTILSNNVIFVKNYAKFNQTYITHNSLNKIKSSSSSVIVADKLYYPFANNSIDKIIIFDYFKSSEITYINSYLRELWRILSPNGKLLIISLNKNSLWSIKDNRIFKNSVCFSCYDLITLLNENFFTTTKSSSRAFMIPEFYKSFPIASKLIDNIGSKWFIPFGGIIFVEAKKNTLNTIFNEEDLNKILNFENANLV